MIKNCVKKVLNQEIEIKKITDRKIFDKIYDENVSSGDWKERSQEERNKIFLKYYIFEVNGVFVGSVGLDIIKNNGDNFINLQCLHVELRGNGIGKTIVEFVKSYGYPIITYSKKGGFFEKCGFLEIPGEFSSTGAKKYLYEIKSIL